MTNKKVQEGLGDLADMAERDHEVQMARAELYKIAKYAIKLHEMLKNVSEEQGLEGWVQSKITKAADYVGSVYHNLDYEMKFGTGEGDEVGPEVPVGEGKSPHKKGTKAYKKLARDVHKQLYATESMRTEADYFKSGKDVHRWVRTHFDGNYQDALLWLEGRGPEWQAAFNYLKKANAAYARKHNKMHAESLQDRLAAKLESKKKTNERSLTKGEEGKREKYVKGMKKAKGDFKDRYGKDAKAVMYATATKMAKKK